MNRSTHFFAFQGEGKRKVKRAEETVEEEKELN
jgi:hypothetical protein